MDHPLFTKTNLTKLLLLYWNKVAVSIENSKKNRVDKR